jgi:hypothetical protein
MTIKSFVTIEVVKNDHTFVFQLPVGAPYGEAYDAAYEVLQNIVELAKNAAEAAKPKADEPTAEAVAAELAN